MARRSQGQTGRTYEEDEDEEAQRDRFEGKKDRAKGHVKETYGKATDNKEKQAEGKWDKTKGNVKETFGEAKDRR